MDPVPKVLCNKNVGANNLGAVWTAADTSQQRHASLGQTMLSVLAFVWTYKIISETYLFVTVLFLHGTKGKKHRE